MKNIILYISLIIFGIAIFIPAFAIATCASTLVVFVDELFTIELEDIIIINGRPNYNR